VGVVEKEREKKRKEKEKREADNKKENTAACLYFPNYLAFPQRQPIGSIPYYSGL
jgi:hypothetical protein